MANNRIYKKEVIETHEDADGNITQSSVTTTTNIQKIMSPIISNFIQICGANSMIFRCLTENYFYNL